MGAVIANDLLIDIGYALLEPPLNTTLNPAGGAVAPGVATVTPGSMVGIYPGAILVVENNGSPQQEAITVTSTTATTFTATFASGHANTAPVIGCTFPSGFPESQMYTQAEILGYMKDSQQDFLLKVRPIYAVGTVNLTVGRRMYPAPADSIRVERASIVNTAANPPTAVELYDMTQTDLDLLSGGWESGSTAVNSWFQDQINTQTIGFGPTPQVGNVVTVFYSQNAIAPLTVLSTFLIPDPMTVAVKWRTLSLCFSKDGEMRDPRKAAFAQQLYDMIVLASKKFLEGTEARMRAQDETVEPLASQRM